MTDPSPLTHFDAAGRAQMVDVGEKAVTHRVAVATGRITMRPETLALIREGRAAKGDVLGVAQVAAIMAAKRTSDLIPMCHPLSLTKVTVAFELVDEDGCGDGNAESGGASVSACAVAIRAQVETRGQTGVEMEALTAASVAALTIYDMVKAVDRAMTIESIQLDHKSGGASGDWQREERSPASQEGRDRR